MSVEIGKKYGSWTVIRADIVDELVEALKNTTAHLIAAHNLLQHGGKKAAASNTMLEIMLNDYEKSIEVGRAALAKLEENEDEVSPELREGMRKWAEEYHGIGGEE